MKSYLNSSLFFNSVFNAGRNVINPLFIAGVSFLFIRHSNMPTQLYEINKIMALVNLLLIFSGWGLKDYLTKDSVKPAAEFNQNWHLAFYSKFILLIPLTVISLFCFPLNYAAFIVPLAILRTFTVLYEPLIILYKRSAFFFSMDLIMSLVILILFYVGDLRSPVFFFLILTISETLKLCMNFILFKKPCKILFQISTLLLFLKDKRFYFFLVLVSFFQSRIDLYLLGFLFSPVKLNEYQLLQSLISLAQISLAAFVVSYSKLFYRNIALSERRFKKVVMYTGNGIAAVSGPVIYLILTTIYHFEFTFVDVLLVVINIAAFAWVLYEMYYYTKQEWLGKMLQFVFLSGLMNFLLSLFLIKPMGLTGALIANTLGQAGLGMLMAWQRLILQRHSSI